MRVSGFKKFLRAYWLRSKVQLMAAVQYRSNLLSGTLSVYGFNLVSLVFISVIFSGVNAVAGWDKWHLITLYGVSQSIFYLGGCFFWSCNYLMGRIIASGDLDRFLLRPVWTIAELVTFKLNLIWALPALALTAVICGVGLMNSGGVEVVNLAFFLLDIPFCVMLVVLPWLIISLLSFWVVDTREISRAMGHVEDLRHYPLEIYPKLVQVIATVFPLAVVAYVPTKFLYYGFDWRWFGIQIASLIVLMTLARWMWHRGLRIYSSVSG